MSRVQHDDAAAFEELYDRHSRVAFNVALAVCRDPHRAEDVAQEGFLSVWRGRSTYSSRTGATFRGWVMETVRNRAIDSIRRETAQKRPPIATGPIPDVPDHSRASPHDEVLARDESRTLEESLERLPERQAEVIALAYFGGLTHSEIAAQLALPEGTVKGRMRLGLEKLRRQLTSAG